ncbi:MAG TPA: SPOR domain-containing protein [Methylomirabilota bacterium]|nr:SPOR domain-containing protein [Methylomirabilota bacterium]
MRYRHVWPGVLLLAALALLLVGLLRWGDHFLSPGPTGGIHRLLQLWAASRPADESIAPPAAAAPSPAMDAPATPPVAAGPPVIVPVPPDATAPAAPSAAAPPAPVAATPVTPPPAPVVKTPPPERAEEPREVAAPPVTPPPVRYSLALGTFPLSEDAERVEAKLNQAGFSTVRFRQQTPSKLFAVQVSSLKDPEEGQATVERLQKEGHPPSVLLVGRTGVTIRVGSPVPLRTAVQLAEKLRAAGYDARVATEPTRAGHVSLRHGNFASRAEAEEASREVARLGVPNEVIQVR